MVMPIYKYQNNFDQSENQEKNYSDKVEKK